ncbi:hypothetical protein [Sphingomonas soli]|uniref:hypothetical protein n=1 Tax=Sphingomonas soli TaxID=266127 RepID=UPI00082C471D|nr:hypothetical protein [Sphingomonas soli]
MTIALLVAALAAAPSGQDVPLPPVQFPTLPKGADQAASFGVHGWALEASAKGDLNADGKPDIAFVLRGVFTANRVKREMCESPLDTNPRILAVAFADGDGYRLAFTDTTLIPRREDGCAVDPFGAESLSIVKGTLRIGFERMMSMGGGDAGSTTFTFRWQDNAMRLIGWDYSNVQRYSGEMVSISLNYLTRRAKTATGRIDSDREKIVWSGLKPAPLLTLDAVGDGLAFDPEGRIAKMP